MKEGEKGRKVVVIVLLFLYSVLGQVMTEKEIEGDPCSFEREIEG